MRLAWLTDIHMDFVSADDTGRFLLALQSEQVDALIISGDIGESRTNTAYLQLIAQTMQRPIYFVLGNHDFYRGQIDAVRHTMRHLTDTVPYLHWLPHVGVVRLSDTTALVGHDGWADGGYGDFLKSSVMLNDYLLIRDLANRTPVDLLAKLRALGQEAADYLRDTLPQALADYERVVVVVHAPPFPQACWHEGKTPQPDDPYMPHFTCKAVGDILLDLVSQHPHTQVTVLCGHTHGSGECQMLPNLHVITGGAVYGKPQIVRIIKA